VLEIDGSKKSGSGTIVRDVIPYCVLLGTDVHLTNIRAKRDKPGLRPQHLKAIEACAQICAGRVEGAQVGSKEIRFESKGIIRGDKFNWDIGTAGSATMLALSVLPLALFAEGPSHYKITGGLSQDFAPSIYHLKYVLLPVLRAMGIEVEIDIIQPGYVPRGNGQIEVKTMPLKDKLRPISLVDQGKVTRVRGIALSSLLKDRKVSERMAKECRKSLRAKGYDPEIEILHDTREEPAYQRVSIQAGASLAVWAETDTHCLIGSDMAGARGRTAEFIGKQTAMNLLEDLRAGATVDRHVADQIIPFAALAEGWSSYLIPRMTEHIEARLWLVDQMLGAKAEVKSSLLRVKGIGHLRDKWS
jgi:RNA 3'-terminal phosphate cyclase (ATP)